MERGDDELKLQRTIAQSVRAPPGTTRTLRTRRSFRIRLRVFQISTTKYTKQTIIVPEQNSGLNNFSRCDIINI